MNERQRFSFRLTTHDKHGLRFRYVDVGVKEDEVVLIYFDEEDEPYPVVMPVLELAGEE